MITEASFLLGRDYCDGPYTEDFIKDLMLELTKFGCKKIVLTGVHFNSDDVGAASYDSESNIFEFALEKRVEGFYHGTGDVFASTIIAGLLNDKTLSEATKIAVDFTEKAIKRTHDAGLDTKYGVLFEKEIAGLIKTLNL